ncbi:MAG: acyl carrier protein [Acidobacteria bacterium]|nr:acyl carrier protein [Acidobacteriota bacterium]
MLSMDQFKNIVADQLGIDPKRIQPDSHMMNDLGADSLAMVNIIAEVESQLDVEFDDLDFDEVQTVSDAYQKMIEEIS